MKGTTPGVQDQVNCLTRQQQSVQTSTTQARIPVVIPDMSKEGLAARSVVDVEESVDLQWAQYIGKSWWMGEDVGCCVSSLSLECNRSGQSACRNGATLQSVGRLKENDIAR
jgi:hypothetical protein